MIARVLVIAAVCAALVSAVPVARRRLEAVSAARLDSAADAEALTNPAAPLLSGSFHVKYSVFALKVDSSMFSAITGWLDRASKLLDGEAWQNTNSDGSVTIKTTTTMKGIGSLLASSMVQVWDKNHGWTQKGKKCTADSVNTQLVIPGTILRESGVFKGTIPLKPIIKQNYAGQRPAADGSYPVDWWDATLPDGAGSVSYYLFHNSKTPLMSHYLLTGKPAAWAQYLSFEVVTNPPEVYAPTDACKVAAGVAASAPATTTLAKLAASNQIAAAAAASVAKPAAPTTAPKTAPAAPTIAPKTAPAAPTTAPKSAPAPAVVKTALAAPPIKKNLP